jgi:cytochrome c oxidase subunit IV
MNLDLLLFVLAAVCFALDAFKVSGPINWTPAGYCLLVIAIWII